MVLKDFQKVIVFKNKHLLEIVQKPFENKGFCDPKTICFQMIFEGFKKVLVFASGLEAEIVLFQKCPISIVKMIIFQKCPIPMVRNHQKRCFLKSDLFRDLALEMKNAAQIFDRKGLGGS